MYFIATWQPLFALCQQQEFWLLHVNQLSDIDIAEKDYLDFLSFPFLPTLYFFFLSNICTLLFILKNTYIVIGRVFLVKSKELIRQTQCIFISFSFWNI